MDIFEVVPFWVWGVLLWTFTKSVDNTTKKVTSYWVASYVGSCVATLTYLFIMKIGFGNFYLPNAYFGIIVLEMVLLGVCAQAFKKTYGLWGFLLFPLLLSLGLILSLYAWCGFTVSSGVALLIGLWLECWFWFVFNKSDLKIMSFESEILLLPGMITLVAILIEAYIQLTIRTWTTGQLLVGVGYTNNIMTLSLVGPTFLVRIGLCLRKLWLARKKKMLEITVEVNEEE